MRIRKTTEQDLPAVMAIYAAARAFMAETGNPRQWGATCWPPEALIREDIRRGRSYVCLSDGDEAAATFFFDKGMDIEPTYRDIRDGDWLDDGPYGVVHRIAADKRRPEKGVGAFCLNWAFSRCGHLRIDTHGDNRVMQGLLRKLGFTLCGTIFVAEDNDPRLAFEKTDGFVCRMPTEAEMVRRWDDEIARQADKANWIAWKEGALASARAGRTLPYYGFLDGVPVCEATADPDPDLPQPLDGKTVELCAFRTVPEHRGKGYFSRLMAYILHDLGRRGFTRAVVGVEPQEERNRALYRHWGFTEPAGRDTETYPDGTVIDVEFFARPL